jgi:hypothetical protein
MPFPSFCFIGALYVAWVFFTWVCFLLEPFFGGGLEKADSALSFAKHSPLSTYFEL